VLERGLRKTTVRIRTVSLCSLANCWVFMLQQVVQGGCEREKDSLAEGGRIIASFISSSQHACPAEARECAGSPNREAIAEQFNHFPIWRRSKIPRLPRLGTSNSDWPNRWYSLFADSNDC
jgi:hypothetical protein